jgi:hypothetical protein
MQRTAPAHSLPAHRANSTRTAITAPKNPANFPDFTHDGHSPDPADQPGVFQRAFNLALSLTAAYPSSNFASRRGRLRRLHGAAAPTQSAFPAPGLPFQPSFDPVWHDGPRIELAGFQWDMYRGQQLPFLEPNPSESDADFAARAHLRTLNLTRVVVDVLSGLYRLPVERTLTGGDPIFTNLLQSAWREVAIDTLLATVDRLTRLQGVCAVQPVWRAGRLGFRAFPAHRLAVVPDSADPATALAVVTLSAGPQWDRRGAASGADFADIWTATEFARVRDGKVVERRTHGYGIPPFAFFRDRAPVEGFWVEGRGQSLCYDNAVFNQRLSDLAQVVALQGFGVLEVVNPDAGTDFNFAPGRVISFRTGGEMPYGINFKHPSAPITEILGELSESIRHILLTQRIPEHALSVNVSGSTSGIAIYAANSPVIEDRMERARLFGAGEQSLLRATAAVASVHAHLPLAHLPELGVSFPEPDLSRTLTERRAHDEWAISRGMLMPWQVMYRDNPDGFTSLAHARAKWLAQREELTRLGLWNPAGIAAPPAGSRADEPAPQTPIHEEVPTPGNHG